MKFVLILLIATLISLGGAPESPLLYHKRPRKVENISPHITYIDSVKSNTAIRHGIENKPTPEHLENMKLVALKCFEPIRNHFKVPIGISSFYRCPELNEKIGGSDSSDHCFGRAIDIDADIYGKITNKDIYEWAKENLEADQIINEYPDSDGNPAWVHISFRESGNRKQCLIAKKVKVIEKGKEKFKTIYVNDPL